MLAYYEASRSMRRHDWIERVSGKGEIGKSAASMYSFRRWHIKSHVSVLVCADDCSIGFTHRRSLLNSAHLRPAEADSFGNRDTSAM